MRVTPIAGERMRFHVTSESGQQPYLVDLSEQRGEGQCGCLHFAMRVNPARRDGKLTYCKHIKAAYGFFGRQMAREIAAKQKQPR